MFRSLRIHLLQVSIAVCLSNAALPSRAHAQTYQIDCAILLCLSGGWPASVPCARARAEFIRRITPWPIEPPLQIWRCPMGASYQTDRMNLDINRVFDILFDGTQDQRLPSSPLSGVSITLTPKTVGSFKDDSPNFKYQSDLALRLVQNRADIDISGSDFNFVRSIRVFDVRYARQVVTGSEGSCDRTATAYVGTYGVQGDFSWARTSLGSLPPDHVGLELWGVDCPDVSHRSVFVEWRDYEGNYGFEQVNY